MRGIEGKWVQSRWISETHLCKKYQLLLWRKFSEALGASIQLQLLGHCSVPLKRHCSIVNAKKKGQSSLIMVLITVDWFKWWNDALINMLKEKPSQKTMQWRQYYPLNASELESTLCTSTGMEGHNVMIEYWGSAMAEYPFSLPSGVPPLIIKLFSWKSSLFLNYLRRWSGNWIFCGGQSFLRAKEKKGELIKRCENGTNWISVQKKKIQSNHWQVLKVFRYYTWTQSRI